MAESDYRTLMFEADRNCSTCRGAGFRSTQGVGLRRMRVMCDCVRIYCKESEPVGESFYKGVGNG